MRVRWSIGIFAAALIAIGLALPGALEAQPGDLPDLDLPEMDGVSPAPPPPRPGMERPGMMKGMGERPGMQDRRRQMMMGRIREDDPERHARLVKIRELAEEYRGTDSDQRKKEIEKELRPLVDEELKMQQKDAREKVEEWEKKLNEFKKILKERDENWDEVVDHNLKKITGQNDYLDFHQMPLRK